MARFQVGHIVRLKSLSPDYDIPLSMHGLVVGVEADKIAVQFPNALVLDFSSQYEPATELERRYKKSASEQMLKELILEAITQHNPGCPPGMDVSIKSLGDGNWEPVSTPPAPSPCADYIGQVTKAIRLNYYLQVPARVRIVAKSATKLPKERSDTAAKERDEWDVSISHASKDKDDFVRPLAHSLRSAGLRVWYDDFTLTVGDSLRRSIDCGLAKSRYGIVVISPNFLKKEWPKKELDGLAGREVGGIKVILPVWHNIGEDGVRAYSPTLADRVAALSRKGIDHVTSELLRAMGKGTNTRHTT